MATSFRDKLTILGQYIEEYWLEHWGFQLMPARQKRFIKKLQKRQTIRVVFFVTDIAMWKYQELYRQLEADKRFELHIVLSPAIHHEQKQKLDNLQKMRTFFTEHGMSFHDWRMEENEPPMDVRHGINPDIVFYTQPYHGVFHPKHCFLKFTDRLIAYYPYCYLQASTAYNYDGPFQNIAWKLFYFDRYSLQDAQNFAKNKARNAVVTGYPSSDIFTRNEPSTAWHDEHHQRKHLIWAPHFSLANEGTSFSRSNFLNLCDFMVELAERYQEQLQIAFKPHPSLYRELCKHPEWGQARADAYYKKWATMPNTQLETGDFVDLFRGSDAMVHDSGSFVLDYLYFNKPVMYISKDITLIKREVSKLSQMAYDEHYIGKDQKDILQFVEDVVLAGNDTKREERTRFLRETLLPGNGKSVAENTYEEIIHSLGLQ
ncbi:MAG: CDP-glycerol glycerophosphotransferase family protein [Prevotella sp.]|nr:CDP-glycerol glycerophosphotransferase family protein [Prevotella sp.]